MKSQKRMLLRGGAVLSALEPTAAATLLLGPAAAFVAGVLLGLLPAQAGEADLRGAVRVDGKSAAEYVESVSGKSYAVVVGIDSYEKFPRLRYAVADAKAVAALLQQQGFEVTTLYDRDATRRRLLRALGDELVAKAGPDDRIVIFFAGHGDERKARGGKEMGFLIPVDGEPDALTETAVSMGLIKEIADALPSKHVLFLVDPATAGSRACPSAARPR